MDWGSKVTYLGSTTLKERAVQFGIKDADRLRHFCVLGRSDSERESLITTMALQDIERGIGTVILDASGKVASLLVERIDPALSDQIVYLDPASAEYPYSWNPLDDIRTLPESVQASYLVELLVSLYNIKQVPFVEHTANLLLKNKESSLITFHSLILNETARGLFFGEDKKAKELFEEEIKNNSELVKTLEEEGRYVAKDTLVRNLLGQANSKFKLSDVNKGKIVIVDFSHIRIFPTRMTPLVRVFVDVMRMISHHQDVPTTLFLHDCLRYLGENEIERIFSSKNVAVTVADTAIQESDRERREFAISRCGSIASFTTHSADQTLIEKAFYPYADSDELSRLDKGELIVALTIDAVRGRPFFAKALSLPDRKHTSYQDLLISSRNRYAVSRTTVDEAFKKQKGDDKKDTPRKRGGGGFQDAFKSIMESRAQNMPIKDIASTKKKEEQPTQEKPKEKELKKEAPASGQEKKLTEIAEDMLKKMLYVAPISIVLFFAAFAPFGVNAGSIASFSFITEPQTIGVGTVSDTITLEAHDASGNPVDGNTVCIEVTSNSLSGEFSTNGSVWGEPPFRTLSLTLNSSWERRNLYYRASAGGSYILTAKAALRPADISCPSYSVSENATWTATQTITVGVSEAPQTTQVSEQSSPPPSVFADTVPLPSEKKITVNAGADKVVFVGADSAFSAHVTGTANEPLENARVVWTFGNGDRKEGQHVLYHFLYPGTYIVVADVSSGPYSATDRMTVTAIPAVLAITEVTNDYIALKNNSSVEIDLGGWILFSAGKQFQFPLNTVVLSGQEVLVSNARTKLSGASPATVALQYPNGLVATAYEQPLFIARATPRTAKGSTNGVAENANGRIVSGVLLETKEPMNQNLITAPVVAASEITPKIPSVFGWILALLAIVGIAIVGVLFVRGGAYREYSIEEVKE